MVVFIEYFDTKNTLFLLLYILDENVVFYCQSGPVQSLLDIFIKFCQCEKGLNIWHLLNSFRLIYTDGRTDQRMDRQVLFNKL